MEKIKAQLRPIANDNWRATAVTKGDGCAARYASAIEAINGAADAEQAFRRLSEWVLSQVALQMEADQVEKQIEKGGQEVLRLLLQGHFDARGIGRVAEALICDRGGEVILEPERVHERAYESIFGTVKIERQAYSQPGQSSLHPLDRELNLPLRKYSYPVQERVSRNVARAPYDEAQQVLLESTAARVAKRQMQQIVQDTAANFDDFYAQRGLQAAWAHDSGPVLVAGIDCKGIPRHKTEQEREQLRPVRLSKGEKRQKKKMATVASVHTQQWWSRTAEQVTAHLMDTDCEPYDSERPKAEHRRVWASIVKSKDEVIEQVAAEMSRRDPDREKTAVCLTDGERALQLRALRQIRAVFPALLVILDIIHVLGYLWEAAYSFHAEGTEQARLWVRERLLLILQGKVSTVAAGMRQSATKQALTGAKRKTVDKACNYLLKNKAFMRYHEYLAAGLPIASGNVEGACGHLVRDRMERTGAIWTEQGAEAVLQLRALEKSGDFDEYWAYHLEREREWNYAEQYQLAA
jgi:hypothetical protein